MNKQFTILHPERMPKGKIKAAIFDFDGTCSTLRCGWERVMEPLMLEEFRRTCGECIQRTSR